LFGFKDIVSEITDHKTTIYLGNIHFFCIFDAQNKVINMKLEIKKHETNR